MHKITLSGLFGKHRQTRLDPFQKITESNILIGAVYIIIWIRDPKSNCGEIHRFDKRSHGLGTAGGAHEYGFGSNVPCQVHKHFDCNLVLAEL